MPYDLAFLHTSQVHIATFDKLVSNLNPELRVQHIVREGLLEDARRDGLTSELKAKVQGALLEASYTGAKVVVCTCSTIGGVAETQQNSLGFHVMRIDRAMADEAVRIGQRILLVAALESTLKPTRELLEDSARNLGKVPEIDMLHVENAWSFFEAGDLENYLATIAQRLERSWQNYDVIVLAQASMAQAVQHCRTVKIPLLSSPKLGVRAAIRAALAND